MGIEMVKNERLTDFGVLKCLPMSAENNLHNNINKLQQDPNANRIKFPEVETEFQFRIDDFEQRSLISSEKYVISEFVHKPTNKLMAVKKIPIPMSRFPDPEKEQKMTKLLREISIHQKLNSSEYIVRFYGFCVHQNEVFICMELMDFSLKEFAYIIHEKMSHFPEDLLGYICVPVVNALRDFKNAQVMHRDIKPSNILLNSKKEIKVCDFGESRLVEGLLTSNVGTIAYLPPERFRSSKNYNKSGYDERSDVWSLGVTLVELIINRLPYMDIDGNEPADSISLLSCIATTELDQILQQCFFGKNNIVYKEETKEFIQACLEEIEKRSFIKQLIEKGFYQKYSNDQIHNSTKKKIYINGNSEIGYRYINGTTIDGFEQNNNNH